MNAIVNFVTTIPIANIHPFEDNPYKVQDNEEMQFLCESIRENGGLSPCVFGKSVQQRNMRLFSATAGCTQHTSWV